MQLGKAILRRISRMPKGLTRTYKEIYEQISADEDQKIVVDRAFMGDVFVRTHEKRTASIRHSS